MSIVSIVPKWSGTDNSIPIEEFFQVIEGTARLGNWSDADQIRVCALRLTETARDCYSATPGLTAPDITWQQFKVSFVNKFRDVRTLQYHLTQLVMARQRTGETAATFLDRL
jgi:hypothetical protein